MTWELPPRTETISVSYQPLDVRLQMLLPDIQLLVRKLIVLADLAAIAMEARQGTDPEEGLDGEAATARAEGIAR